MLSKCPSSFSSKYNFNSNVYTRFIRYPLPIQLFLDKDKAIMAYLSGHA